MIREVTFYETDTGNRPVEAFLDTLSTKQALKVAWVIGLVEDMEIVPTEYFQKMSGTDDLWGIRVKAAGNIFRFLGFFDSRTLVVLSHAFQKKTQKTPQQAIRLAEDRKRDYFRRNKR